MKRSARRDVDWAAKAEWAEKAYPGAGSVDWHKVLTETDVFASVMREILRFDMAPSGRDGSRPAVSEEQGALRLSQLLGQDYTTLPFREVVGLVARGDSCREIAQKTGIPRESVRRLLRGYTEAKGVRYPVEPTAYDLEQIAKAYGRDPSYFMEYRILYVTGAVVDFLRRHPDVSVSTYRRVRRSAKRVQR